jgi:DNA repair exonuclease SbcCD ATPase subunit
MNGLFNKNFLYGYLLARDREDQNEKLNFGLTAGQFPRSNPLGLVLLKRQIDTLEEVEGERETLRQRVEELESGENGQPRGVIGTPVSSVNTAELQAALAFWKEHSANATERVGQLEEELTEHRLKLATVMAELEGCRKEAQERLRRVISAFEAFEFPLNADLSDEQTKMAMDAVKELRGRIVDIVTPTQ